jgi:signal transduction histidine kinase
MVDVADGVVATPAWWLDRLLSELLDNAFKFSAAGSPVRVLGRFGAGRFRLSVQDAGRGMSAEQIAAVGAFQQFDRHRYEQQGVGLGLYLANRIAELHGGELELTSEPGTGTTAVAALPSAA